VNDTCGYAFPHCFLRALYIVLEIISLEMGQIAGGLSYHKHVSY